MTEVERRGVNELVDKLNTKEDEIVELEKSIQKKKFIIDQLNVQLEEVEKENKELKAFINAPHTKGRKTTRADYIKTVWDLSKKLNEAKDLIRNLLRVTYGEGWNYSLDWKAKAEEFIKEE